MSSQCDMCGAKEVCKFKESLEKEFAENQLVTLDKAGIIVQFRVSQFDVLKCPYFKFYRKMKM